MSSVQAGSIGTVIEFQVLGQDGAPLDISNAVSKKLIFKRPNGTTVEKPAVFTSDGSDGRLQVVSVENDLEPYGAWQIQAAITRPGLNGRSEVERFGIDRNL